MDGFTEAVEEIGYQGIRRGDLVVHSMDGFAGAIGVSDSDGKASPVVHAYTPKEGVEPRYYAYALRTLALNGFIESLARGIRERSTAFDGATLKEVLLPRPPIEEQRRIADMLDAEVNRIDTMMSLRYRQCEVLEGRKAAMIRAELAQIVASHDVPYVPIRYLAKVQRGASPRPIDDPKYFDDQGSHAWVRIADVTASEKYLESASQHLSNLGRSQSVSLRPGELFVSIAASVGKPIITRINCCIHDGFVALRNPAVEPEYLYYFLLLGDVFGGLGKLGTQLNLNSETIGSIRLPVPDRARQLELVRRIAAYEASAGRLRKRLLEQTNTLKERKGTLISEAITGRLGRA